MLKIKLLSLLNKTISKIFIWLYIIFIVGFFVLSTRMHRNYFYLFLLIPFFLSTNISCLKKIKYSKIFLVTSFFCVYMFITLLWADGVSLEYSYESIRKGFLVVIFLVLTMVFFQNNWDLVPRFFKYTCFLAGVFSCITMILFYDTNQLSERITGMGTLDNPIMAGNSYALVVLIAFFYFLVKKEVELRDKIKYFLVVVAAVMFVVLSQSRGPLLALAVTLICCAVVFTPKYLSWILVGFILPLMTVYFSGLVNFTSLITRADSYRISIWQQSWDIFLQHPLFGYGFGGARPEIFIAESLPASHSHNLFLATMLDGGVVALVLIVALLVISTFWSIRYFRETGDVTLLALMMFAVLGNLTDGKTPIASPNHQWLYFWLPIGLVGAYELRHRLVRQPEIAVCKAPPIQEPT